jgi:peptide/nickel transport system substrate-binding protein
MKQHLRAIAAVGGFLVALSGGTAVAQKAGGVLKMYHFDSPASLSLHEEVTYAALGPAMGLFNNLVMFRSAFAASQPPIYRAGSGNRVVVGLIQKQN